MDTKLIVPSFDWPNLKYYYYKDSSNPDVTETWLRLRHNILTLIPYRPQEIRNREKIDVIFYIPTSFDSHESSPTLNLNTPTDEN
jgi:hypothetical protein